MIIKLYNFVCGAAIGELSLVIPAAVGTSCAALFGRTLHYESLIILGLNVYALLRVIEYTLKRYINKGGRQK